MTLTPSNKQEVNEFFAFERNIQKQLDEYYRGRGHHPSGRPGNKQYDLKLNGTTVEEKIRSEIRSDILIEILQDINTHNLGWFYTTEADYIHYVMCDEEKMSKLLRFKWSPFKEWIIQSYLPSKEIGQYVISKKGYGLTLNIPIKTEEIPCELVQMVDIAKEGMEDNESTNS